MGRVRQPWTVTYSVPVFSLDPGKPEPVGVLGMATDLRLTEKIQGTRNQFAVLIDTRPDETEKRGVVVVHPFQDRLRPDATFQPIYVNEEVVDRARRVLAVSKANAACKAQDTEVAGQLPETDYRGTYADPILKDDQNQWLATLAPVCIPGVGGEIDDTGWVVLVQERYQQTIAPVHALTNKLMRGGLLGLLLVMTVVSALWGVVMYVVNASPGSRLPVFLRRYFKVPTTASGISSSPSSSSGSQRGTDSGGSVHARSPSSVAH